jgi:NADP-dependent 3-hydroxy acid dehydrogenase YdfG
MRRVLITGAVGGMGAAIVADLARDREVIATARDAVRLAALTDRVGATGWVGDLTDHGWLASQVATLDRLDELVHVAAVGTHVAPEFATADDFRAQLEINLIAPAELTRLCLPLLRASRGTVIFIGSGASTRPVPGSAIYPATKHALKAYADVLRLDESRNGLRVSTVAPGPTATGMYETSQREAGRPYEPERLIAPDSVARVVRFVLDATDDVHLTDVAVRPREEPRCRS